MSEERHGQPVRVEVSPASDTAVSHPPRPQQHAQPRRGFYHYLFQPLGLSLGLLALGFGAFFLLVMVRDYLNSVQLQQSITNHGPLPAYSPGRTELIPVLGPPAHYLELRRELEQANTTLNDELEKLRQGAQNMFQYNAERAVRSVFLAMHERVPAFADWFFSYATTYRQAFIALGGILDHWRPNQVLTITQSASIAVQDNLIEKFETMVTKPHLIEEELQRALRATSEETLEAYTQAEHALLVAHEQRFKDLFAPYGHSLSLQFPWRKNDTPVVRIAALKSKMASEGIMLASFGMGMAVLGSTIGAKSEQQFMVKMLEKRLLATGRSALFNRAAGMLLGVGTVALGLGIGVLLDYSLHEHGATQERPDFECDLGTHLSNLEFRYLEMVRGLDLRPHLRNDQPLSPRIQGVVPSGLMQALEGLVSLPGSGDE